MFRPLASLAALAVLSLPAHADSSSGASDLSEKVEVSLSEAGVEATCTIERREFFGKQVVTAGPQVKNASDQKMEAVVHLAVFDAEGRVVAVATQHTDLDPGEETYFGSTMAFAPGAALDRVASYQIVFYAWPSKE